MRTYFANFKANNGTSLMEPITGTNKSILIKDIRHIAEANRFAGNECSWSVFIKEGENFISVARGGMWSDGSRWRDNTPEIL